MSQQSVTQRYLTERQYADYTGISKSTAAEMRARGDGPPFIRFGANDRFSGTIRYDIRDVDAWLDRFKIAPGSAEPGATSRLKKAEWARRKAASRSTHIPEQRKSAVGA